MADRTAIEWTDATWNPVRGCTRVSEGCRFCFAEAIAARFSDAGAPYHGFADRMRTGSKWTGRVEVIWPLLDLPLRWQRPRRIFVNSMSDLFHQALSIPELAHIYAVMVAAVHLRGHIFQVLTKRPGLMRHVLAQQQFWEQVNAEATAHIMDRTDPLHRRSDDARATHDENGPDHPPPGIWLGTSVEDQPAADERLPELAATPAALRFLSCEPLLEAITPSLTAIDWVICGGESGPNARPMHPDWARNLRDQCTTAGVPFFFKQWGEWVEVDGPKCRAIAPDAAVSGSWILPDGRLVGRNPTSNLRYSPYRTPVVAKLGKKRAGAMLDGREWREMPR